jgi:hypothetical protein
VLPVAGIDLADRIQLSTLSNLTSGFPAVSSPDSPTRAPGKKRERKRGQSKDATFPVTEACSAKTRARGDATSSGRGAGTSLDSSPAVNRVAVIGSTSNLPFWADKGFPTQISSAHTATSCLPDKALSFMQLFLITALSTDILAIVLMP